MFLNLTSLPLCSANPGLFTGCFIALLAGYVIMAHLMGLYTKQSPDTVYMETVYPVLRQDIFFLPFQIYE